MEKLFVDLGENAYDIVFETSFALLPACMKEIDAPKKLLIVTDTNVEKLYGGEVQTLLKESGFDTALFAFPAGEEHKNMESILQICTACMKHNMDRSSMIVALGGGVVGDMAGFAAAIYMRGIRFIQVPTTLLAQSDSSVGGKTGIDFLDGKNILGAFHQPKLVYMNVMTLKTLPEREFISGMGEVIKHGIIRDAEFFDFIAGNAEAVRSLNGDVLIRMAKANCAVKADVVIQDEKETGLRAILNFGHTIGHGVESAFAFSKTHGECVGLGMVGASYLAWKRNLISDEVLKKIEQVLALYDFPVKVELPPADTVLSFMRKDKKASEGKLKFVLPEGIGQVIQVTDVTDAEIKDALRYIEERTAV